jgi:hypothetical protein
MSAKPHSLIYLVTGSEGDYEEHSLWAVAAYAKKAMAEQHAKLAGETSQRAQDRRQRQFIKDVFDARVMRNKYDPYMGDKCGATYFVQPVRLRSALPK